MPVWGLAWKFLTKRLRTSKNHKHQVNSSYQATTRIMIKNNNTTRASNRSFTQHGMSFWQTQEKFDVEIICMSADTSWKIKRLNGREDKSNLILCFVGCMKFVLLICPLWTFSSVKLSKWTSSCYVKWLFMLVICHSFWMNLKYLDSGTTSCLSDSFIAFLTTRVL